MVHYSDTGTMVAGIYITDFKWWSEYLSVKQMILSIPKCHGTGHLSTKQFNHKTNLHNLSTQLVCYSDPHCTMFLITYNLLLSKKRRKLVSRHLDHP